MYNRHDYFSFKGIVLAGENVQFKTLCESDPDTLQAHETS